MHLLHYSLLLTLFYATSLSVRQHCASTTTAKDDQQTNPFVVMRNGTVKRVLKIGAILDTETDDSEDSSGELIPVLQLALDHVNASPRILSDYEIQLEVKDVKCTDAGALRALIEFLKEEQQVLMVIGSVCPQSTLPFAKVAHYYNLVQISMAMSNPTLNYLTQFPTLVRGLPSESLQNIGRVDLVKSFNWKNIAVVYERALSFESVSHDLVFRLRKANFTVLAHEEFGKYSRDAVETVVKQDARIMFGLFRENTARKVMCEAFQLGMCGAKYVWILMSGNYMDKWWSVNDTSCTTEQVREAVGHYIGTRPMMEHLKDNMTVAGKEVQELWNASKSVKPYAAFAYDAVWTAALSLNRTLGSFSSFNSDDPDISPNRTRIRTKLLNAIKETKFQGMSGRVQYDEKYERIVTLRIEQLQGSELREIGDFKLETEEFKIDKEKKVKWDGQSKPSCALKKVPRAEFISPFLLYMMGGLCAVGVVVAVCFLVFNIKNMDVRYIKMSSPRLNNLIILGCILVYISGILAGIDGQFVSHGTQILLCKVQTWTVALGFTLAFGALFSKTWRVHLIFLHKTEKMVIRDYQLFGVVFGFLLVDVTLLLSWQVIDPIFITKVQKTPELMLAANTEFHPFICMCSSSYFTTWTSVLYGYKGFLLLFGAYLAWETREVSIPVLNDSKMIGISVYNVVIPCILVIPLLHVIRDNVNAVYGMTALLCVLCTSVTLCLIFIPKIMQTRKPENAENRSTESSPTNTLNSQTKDGLCSGVYIGPPGKPPKTFDTLKRTASLELGSDEKDVQPPNNQPRKEAYVLPESACNAGVDDQE